MESYSRCCSSVQVQTRSGVVVDSTGREVAVGSLTKLWHKLQAANRDRHAQETKTDTAGRLPTGRVFRIRIRK